MKTLKGKGQYHSIGWIVCEKMKKANYLLMITLLLIVLASCSAGNENQLEKEEDAYFDKLDGNQVSEAAVKTELRSIDYAPYFDSDTAPVVDLTTAIEVDLSSPSGKNISYSKNKLTITAGGTYVLSGTLDGCVSVDGVEEDVTIVLNGATIQTLDSQSAAALVFKSNNANRLLYIQEGTENHLSDSQGDTDLDGDSAVIQAKKSSLTIAGAGHLTLTSNGENTTGIKVKKHLSIYNTSIDIDVVNNGIKADECIYLQDVNLVINAGNDGIKTDIEPATIEEAYQYAAEEYAGFITILSSNLNITAVDDGISANNGMYIRGDNNNLIKIKTNGGAPATVTERSSDAADGKGIKVGGITYTATDGTETNVASQLAQNYYLIIDGGTFDLNCNDDAISSKGHQMLLSGSFTIATGDDGIHSEYVTQIEGGHFTITKSYEGIEGAIVDISSGDIKIVSTDDGINAANADLDGDSFYIYISGGNILVNAQGDGIDSNGTIEMSGGNVVVFGPTGAGDASLDADKGIIITGGNLIAFGSSGMVESPSSSSTQSYVVLNLSSGAGENTAFTIMDATEDVIYTVTPSKSYQSVIISLNTFEDGNSYVITVGGSSYEITLSGIANALGNVFNGQGGMVPHTPSGPGKH